MASQSQQETNRKILEDLQIKKQLLQKGGSTLSATTANNMTQFMPTSQILPTLSQDSFPINSTALQRSAWASANSQSFGFFVPQDSIFGNSILPVLPRFDNPAK